MAKQDREIVQGILISEAATIVENAFRAVLGMSDDDLAKLSPDDEFGKYCDNSGLTAILDFVQNDAAEFVSSVMKSWLEVQASRP